MTLVVSVAEQASLSLTWSHNSEDRPSPDMAQLFSKVYVTLFHFEV